MLHQNTVEPGTLGTLKRLMQLPELKQFALVGGTNLALRLGHRASVDLDIFTNEPFDLPEAWDAVRREFPSVIKLDERGQTLLANIDGVKIDLIKHAYPYLLPVEEIEGIRMLSIPDIIPMKLGALARRGSKKDFWDIACLLDHYSLPEMLEFFKRKYQNDDIGYVVMSLTYFEDAENQDDPVVFQKMTWDDVKNKVRATVLDYMKRQNL